MDSMMRNQVWELINLPPQCKSIKNKWFFKIKRLADRIIGKFKVGLVTKGLTQIKGVDYKETFSRMVRIASIRLLLALLAYLDLELIQMNVKTASSMVVLRKKSTWINLLVLYQKVKKTKFVVLKDLFMVSNSLL